MAEGTSGHPILTYLTFVVPALLLVLAVVFDASILFMIMTILWLGVAFGVLYLPLVGDNGSRA